MEQIRTLSALLAYAKKIGKEQGPKKVAVAMAEDAGLISALEEARVAGFANSILVGNGAKIKPRPNRRRGSRELHVIDECNEGQMGMKSVALVSSGEADI
jgi:phosphate butyryltransferase